MVATIAALLAADERANQEAEGADGGETSPRTGDTLQATPGKKNPDLNQRNRIASRS